MVSFNLPGPQKEDARIAVHNDVLAVAGGTRSASEPVKDMGSASGNKASLGGRARSPKGQGKIRLCAFTSKAELLKIFITDSE
jgi:hypothetical protein